MNEGVTKRRIKYVQHLLLVRRTAVYENVPFTASQQIEQYSLFPYSVMDKQEVEGGKKQATFVTDSWYYCKRSRTAIYGLEKPRILVRNKSAQKCVLCSLNVKKTTKKLYNFIAPLARLWPSLSFSPPPI